MRILDLIPKAEAKGIGRKFLDFIGVKNLKVIKAEDPEACKPFFQNPFGDEVLAGGISWCENTYRGTILMFH